MSFYKQFGDSLERICEERGIPTSVGIGVFVEFIKTLHETKIKASSETSSLLHQVFFTLGDEATYHLGCLLHEHGDELALEELARLDGNMFRFGTTVARWQLEEKTREEGRE